MFSTAKVQKGECSANGPRGARRASGKSPGLIANQGRRPTRGDRYLATSGACFMASEVKTRHLGCTGPSKEGPGTTSGPLPRSGDPLA